MLVNFYKHNDDKRVVSKRLTALASLDCQLQDECGILNPRIIVSRTNLTAFNVCNYIYIPTFKRYYYAEITAMVGDMLLIQGDVDVLMSYREGIRGITCDILRQEYNYNQYYVDTMLPKRNTKNIQYLKIGDLPSTNSIYLTVTGGA